MSLSLQDVGLALLTVAVLSPLAVHCFRSGVPIELIIFGLLVAGYKASHCLGKRLPGAALLEEAHTGGGVAAAAGAAAGWQALLPWGIGGRQGPKGEKADALPSVCPTGEEAQPPSGAERRRRPEEAPGRRASEGPAAAAGRSGLAALKKASPQLQWRGLINKFTPEKFDKLCDQLLATLPTEGAAVSAGEFRKVLEDLLTLIFEASSRQHQYTEMYTDLTEKMLSFVAKQQPDLDGQACVWEKCQHIFLTMVLKPPEIPTDLPEDEYMDRKAKTKEKMVGMVKLGGDLVSRGLVPCDGVMQWIHQLLSEKTQEVYSSSGEETVPQEDTLHDKDMEQREVQLEVLCAILASMGSSLSDRNTWSQENRLVIEDVFMQLEQLSMDTAHLSLRIRCLIRDILDLRMAQWKEKEGKLKPGMLHPRKKDSDDEQGDGQESHEVKQWLDPQLLSSLQAVKHHLEVYDDKDAKFTRLTSLIKVYHIMKEKQIVIVANSGNVKQVLELIAESFHDIECKSLDFSTPEAVRKKCIKGFELGETSVLVMASEVSTRRDFDFGKPAPVLVNFDFPMTLQLYLYRIFKRADGSTHVYTFFSPHTDVRHTSSLIAALDGAKQQVPAPLQKLKDQVRTEGGGKRDAGNRRTPKNGDSKAEPEDEGAQRAPPWKERRSAGENSREERGEHHWDDSWSRDETGEGARGGNFRSGKSRSSTTSWRESKRDDREEPKAEEQCRRREISRKSEGIAEPPDADGWQKLRTPNNRRSAGGGARGKDSTGGDTPATPAPEEPTSVRSERPPWFEPSIVDAGSEPRRQILQRSQSDQAGQPVSQRSDRKGESDPYALRVPTCGSSVASSSPSGQGASTMRHRRHDASSVAETPNADSRSRPRFGDIGADAPAERERRYPGADKRDLGQPAGGTAIGLKSGSSLEGGGEGRQAPQHGHRHRPGVGRASDQGSRREYYAAG